jgi:serine/threonine protein kinase
MNDARRVRASRVFVGGNEMSMLSPVQQVSYGFDPVSAEHQQEQSSCQPSNPQRDSEEALAHDDAEWVSAQSGASVGCMHRIVRHLASGGMGHVFVAEHVHLGANAAVKVPRYADATGRRILEAEAKLLAKLEHPNIVKALDVGQLADGRAYLLMEYASGIELEGLLSARGKMSVERCLAVLRQLACAVDYVHLKGIVHGDIKPANILIDVSANDFIKLVDFGIASASTRNERRGVLGTPAYMAPEQARGDAWGALSDVYAVAALALEMLTGHPPYNHHTAQDVLTAIFTEPPPLPSTRGLSLPGLDAVFERGLNADPEQRYPRATAFVNALAEVLNAANTLPIADNENDAQALVERESGVQLRVVNSEPKPRPAIEHERTPLPSAMGLAPLWNGRAALRLAACLVAAACAFSVYG